MESTKKEKTINVGLSTELMDYFNKMLDIAVENSKEEKGKLGNEVKVTVVEIVKREIEKIDKLLKKDDLDKDEWFDAIEKIDKLTDLIRWF